MDTTTQQKLFRLSNSSLNQFYSCPTKFALTKLSSLPAGERRNSAASLIGTAIHEAFQYYLIYGVYTDALKVLILKYPMKLKKAMTGKYHFLTAVKLLEGLVKWYMESGLELLYINEKPAIEFKINTIYEISNWDYADPSIDESTSSTFFEFIGFIDAIFVRKETGELVVCDIKTSSTTTSIEEDYVKYSLSPQTVEYVANLLNLLGYSQEDAQKVISSITVLYLVARFNGTEYEVSPLEFCKKANDITNLENGIRFLLKTIKQNGTDSLNYYRSGNCKNFGTQCEFFDLCSTCQSIPLLEGNREEPVINKDAYQSKTIRKEIRL